MCFPFSLIYSILGILRRRTDTHGFKPLEDTTFSGISSYRTDPEPYKSNSDDFSFSSSREYYQVARTHFDELSKHLASYLAKGSIISPPVTFRLHNPPLQNQQIPARQHDRNSRGLRASNVRNYLQTSMTNC